MYERIGKMAWRHFKYQWRTTETREEIGRKKVRLSKMVRLHLRCQPQNTEGRREGGSTRVCGRTEENEREGLTRR